mgnify:CR=1 FL=1
MRRFLIKIQKSIIMRITIEGYRLYFLTFMFFTAILTLNEFFGFGIPKGYLFPILLIGFLPVIILVLTSIKNKHIKAYWKKGNKLLKIPFQNSEDGITLKDEDGNTYNSNIKGFLAYDEQDNMYIIKAFTVTPISKEEIFRS